MTKRLKQKEAKLIQLGKDIVDFIKVNGETLEALDFILGKTSKIICKAKDKDYDNEYIRSVLDIYTIVNTGLLYLLLKGDNLGFSDPEKFKKDRWNEIIQAAEEMAGIKPMNAYNRNKLKWTEHWMYFLERDSSPKIKKEIIEAALSKYPDFDISIFNKYD